MAYNFQDIDPESIDFKQQSDEARKKRLAAAAALMGGGSFTDMLGQYATDRVAQTTDKLGQVGQTLENPQQAVEQRMGMKPVAPTVPEQPQQLQQQPPLLQPQPLKQQQPLQQP